MAHFPLTLRLFTSVFLLTMGIHIPLRFFTHDSAPNPPSPRPPPTVSLPNLKKKKKKISKHMMIQNTSAILRILFYMTPDLSSKFDSGPSMRFTWRCNVTALEIQSLPLVEVMKNNLICNKDRPNWIILSWWSTNSLTDQFIHSCLLNGTQILLFVTLRTCGARKCSNLP